MAFVPDEEAPASPVFPAPPTAGRFIPDERRAAQSKSPGALDYLRAFGTLAIPGGAGMKAMQLLDKAAYETGGAVTDFAAKHVSPELAGAAGAVANVGVQALPMLLGGGAGKTAAPIFDEASKGLMQGALKPTIGALKSGKAARAIDTMLKEGVNVSRGGVEALRSEIGALNSEIMKAIATSPATVDKGKVAAELFQTVKKFEKQVTPNSDVAAITKAWDEFLNHPLLAGQNAIPVKLAQELKQGTYRALGDKAYGELKGAEIEAQKALARGLKNEISNAVPGVSALNARESELLNAMSIAERRVLIAANKNPASFAWIAKNPEMAAGWLADKSEVFKSMLARALYSGQEQIPATVGRLFGATAGAYSGLPPREQ